MPTVIAWLHAVGRTLWFTAIGRRARRTGWIPSLELLSWLRSGFASGVTHAVALGALSVVIVNQASAPQQGDVLVAFAVSEESLPVDADWEPEPITVTAQEPTESALPGTALDAGAATDVAPADLAGLLDAPPAGEISSLHHLVEAANGLLGESAGADAAGNLPGQAGGGHGASFFGASASGNDFVFVVDLSGSMDGHRFRRARGELRRSLQKLAANQRFFVIFFNSSTFPMPQGRLVDASRPELYAAEKWIADARPNSFTYPGEALQMALAQKPDAVFFLTDGEFDPAVVEALPHAASGESAPIHAIAFGSRIGEGLLKAIATKSGGTYRFVP